MGKSSSALSAFPDVPLGVSRSLQSTRCGHSRVTLQFMLLMLRCRIPLQEPTSHRSHISRHQDLSTGGTDDARQLIGHHGGDFIRRSFGSITLTALPREQKPASHISWRTTRVGSVQCPSPATSSRSGVVLDGNIQRGSVVTLASGSKRSTTPIGSSLGTRRKTAPHRLRDRSLHDARTRDRASRLRQFGPVATTACLTAHRHARRATPVRHRECHRGRGCACLAHRRPDRRSGRPPVTC